MREMGKDAVFTGSERQFYDIELEVQNQELRGSRALLEETLDLYAGLYDFAAVGCVTFDERGCLTSLNLTAAELLAESRDRVVGVPFSQWVHRDSHPAFFAHLRQLRVGPRRLCTRLGLRLRDGTHFTVLLISLRETDHGDDDEEITYRSAIIDLRDLEGA